MTTTGQGDPAVTLGWRLRIAVEQCDGMTVQRMADLLGVHRATVTRWTHDEIVPRRAFVAQWAAITGVDPDWLEGRPPADQRPPADPRNPASARMPARVA